MKQLRLLKALCLLFALLMIVTATAGCTGKPGGESGQLLGC